jgi:hypothetical protein
MKTKRSPWSPTNKELGQLRRLYGGMEKMILVKNGGVMIRRRLSR